MNIYYVPFVGFVKATRELKKSLDSHEQYLDIIDKHFEEKSMSPVPPSLLIESQRLLAISYQKHHDLTTALVSTIIGVVVLVGVGTGFSIVLFMLKKFMQ